MSWKSEWKNARAAPLKGEAQAIVAGKADQPTHMKQNAGARAKIGGTGTKFMVPVPC